MAELRPFATAKQAADIGGITPTDIGVSATTFVRKSELVRTGKFDETSLVSYQDTWFVNLDAVKSTSVFGVLPMTLSFKGSEVGSNYAQILKVTSSNGFTVSTDDSWINAVKMGNDEVQVYMKSENAGGDRQGVITVMDIASGVTLEIVVVQSSTFISDLVVSPVSMNFGANPTSGKDLIITVTGSWTIE